MRGAHRISTLRQLERYDSTLLAGLLVEVDLVGFLNRINRIPRHQFISH
jgi:hypothetical protein